MWHRDGPHLPPRDHEALGDCGAKGDCHGVRSEHVSGTRFRAMGNLDREARSGSCHAPCCPCRSAMAFLTFPRSEEHTSELQSHSDLVCRLLLEKKKKTNKR